MLSFVRILIGILCVAVGLAFGFLNFQSTQVNLLWQDTRAPLVILLAVAFVLGLIVAGLLFASRLIRLRSKLANARRELKNAESENAALRRASSQHV